MKLYSGPVSLFTAKVRIALDEKGLDYERVEVGWNRKDRYLPHHPDVVALNPKAQVPVLVDGDLVIYDSTIILEYLDEQYPATPLYPKDPADRAICRQLEAAADEILFEPLWTLIDRIFYPQEGAGEDPAVAAARKKITAYQDELEKRLADKEHLCGAYSVADIGNFVMLSAAAQFGSPPGQSHPNLLAWFGRVGSRPPVSKDAQAMVAFVADLA